MDEKTETQGLKRLRKNPEEQTEAPKNVSLGLKPVLVLQLLTARLKSCPDASFSRLWILQVAILP